jgi:hypothetical protein
MKHNLLYFFNAIRTLLGGVESKYKANDHTAYQIRCPYCLKNGSVLGLGRDRESYLLLCPNCDRGYSLHTLIQDHGTDDLRDAWWKFQAGWIDYKQLGYPIKDPKSKGGQVTATAPRNFRSKMRVSDEMAGIFVNREREDGSSGSHG